MEQNIEQLKQFIFQQFDEVALPSLQDYIRIPNLSQAFDKDWNTNGLLDQAAKHLVDWFDKQGINGAKTQTLREDMKAPLIFTQIDRTDNSDKTILFYGHYDKQPHFIGWHEGFSATNPVIKDDKLYGRGGADDGYAFYAATLTIKTLQHFNIPHPRIIIIVEGAEESSSQNLMYYLEKISDQIGTPNLIICTDSGAGNYETFWSTASLRGNLKVNVTVQVLTEGVHSGDASGIVPSSFRILRNLLDRVEDSKTGQLNSLFEDNIPSNRYSEIEKTVKVLGKDEIIGVFPFHGNMQPTTQNPMQAYINRTWRPQLATIGADHLPPVQTAGNVLRPETTLKFSLRLPPTLDGKKAGQNLKQLLEENPPHNAKVTVDVQSAMQGWNCPDTPVYIQQALQESSQFYYGKEPQCLCEGGSIPFMNLLQEKWPNVSYLVTGVLGPYSNAHGPNEFLHLTFTKKLIGCLVEVVKATSMQK